MNLTSILGIGTARPAHSIPQHEAVNVARIFTDENARQERLLPALYRRTEVQSRGSVLLEGEQLVANGHVYPGVDRSSLKTR